MTANVTTQLPQVAGYSDSITLPANNAPAGSTLNLTIGLSAAAGIPAATPALYAKTTMLYFNATTTKTVTFNNKPGFTITLPSSAQLNGQQINLAMYDPQRGWITQASGTVNGRTAVFAPTGDAVTLAAGAVYSFVVYSPQRVAGCPTPEPPQATPTPSPSSTPVSTSASLIYEADQYSKAPGIEGVVNVFDAKANGDAVPLRQIIGTSQYNAPIGVAVDHAGNAYICYNHATDGAVAVYSPDANGTATPQRLIQGPSTKMYKCNGVAVDSSGNIYELDSSPNGLVPQVVNVFSSGANGDAPPVRQLVLSSSGCCLSVDDNQYLYFSSGRNINVFGPKQSGNSAPERTITMADQNSQLGFLDVVAGSLYVQDSYNGYAYVVPASSSGTVTPSRTLNNGYQAGWFFGPIVAGADGSIYASQVKGGSAGQNPPQFAVFPPGANGTVTPTQDIYGADVQHVMALAVH